LRKLQFGELGLFGNSGIEEESVLGKKEDFGLAKRNANGGIG
jgi:hypothetical protein